MKNMKKLTALNLNGWLLFGGSDDSQINPCSDVATTTAIISAISSVVSAISNISAAMTKVPACKPKG